MWKFEMLDTTEICIIQILMVFGLNGILNYCAHYEIFSSEGLGTITKNLFLSKYSEWLEKIIILFVINYLSYRG